MRHGFALLLLLLLLLSTTFPALAKEMSPYRHGYDQGRQAGGREGRERADPCGGEDGDADGYATGLIEGQQILIDAAFTQGLAQGQADGHLEGQREGRLAGLAQGQKDGREEGESQAKSAADQTAQVAVKERASADGVTRATAANPQADGLRLGRQAGLERAKLEANEKDFSRARDDYRAKSFATPVKGSSEVRQSPLAVAPNAWTVSGSNDLLFGRHYCPSPDNRYFRYGSDNEEYQRGYRTGYDEGFRDQWSDRYDWLYRRAYDRAYAYGASLARVPNLQQTVDGAYQQGFVDTRDSSFQSAQQAAHKDAYAATYETAFAQAYATYYPQFEAQHYREQEEQAYQAVYGPPFQTAFATHEREAFEESYPKEAKVAYDAGWKAEANDFVKRPVRLVSAWVTPTDVPGVQLLSVKLRNFSPQAVAGKRVRVSLGSQTSRLYHSIPAQNVMTVTGLLRVGDNLPSPAELFAVIETDGMRLPLGTVTLGAAEK